MEKKESFLFKKLDVTFVYLFVFLVGIAIVLAMTSYLNTYFHLYLLYLFYFLLHQHSNYIIYYKSSDFSIINVFPSV